jgi:rare lipoprotein A (peptidoglycan hydrolase)
MGEYTIDLSKEAFKRIADLKTGVIDVKVRVIK